MDQKNNEFTIGGVKVLFPKKPYPSQISLMNKIIKGLQKKENCLLESPTGSGKTLSLLCSALAWQKSERDNIRSRILEDDKSELMETALETENHKNKLKKHVIQYEDSKENIEMESTYNESQLEVDDTPDHQKSNKVPKIFYTTRTHKQIANVIKELKKTPYAKDVRMTILASRSHTCINPIVSKAPNKDDFCKKLNKGKLTDEERGEQGAPSGCSFLTRFKKQSLVYENYGFKQPAWDIEDLVASFKRKRFCPYYGSRDLMEVVDIVFCPYNYLIDPRIRSAMKIKLRNQIVIVDEAHNIEDSCRESTTFAISKYQMESALKEMRETIKYSIKPEVVNSVVYFVGVFDKLIGWIDENTSHLNGQSIDAAISRIYNGFEIVNQFKLLGIGPENFQQFIRYNQSLNPEGEEEEVTSEAVKILISQFELILEFLYTENHEFMDDFKVAITKTKIETKTLDESSYFSQANKTIEELNKWTYTINFWCLNPAVAFYYLKSCHSVILCSGTLCPMDTFQSELGTKFEHTLEANHVISDKQVWVGCLGYGPTDVNLLATYKNIETFAFQDEIGRLIIDICKAIPYGVLCFFPSYSVLNKLVNRWNSTKMTDNINQYKKIFNEGKMAKDFDQLLKDYYDCIDSCTSTDSKGALLLAVYRGRASEGLDFSDNYARAVIAFGIPYPNVKDVQVDLKRKYNNLLSSKKNLLNGDDWYEIQAYRAINQALGRCIRHRDDWGAIILVDDRYFRQPQKYTKGLSKWIRNKFQTYRNYNEALQSLKDFSKNMINENINKQKAELSQCENACQFNETKSIDASCCQSYNSSVTSTISIKSINSFKKPGYSTLKNFLNRNNDDDCLIQSPKPADDGDFKFQITQLAPSATSTQIGHSKLCHGATVSPRITPIKTEKSIQAVFESNSVGRKKRQRMNDHNRGDSKRLTNFTSSSPSVRQFEFKKQNNKMNFNSNRSPTVIVIDDDEHDKHESSSDIIDETIDSELAEKTVPDTDPDDDDSNEFEADFKKPKQEPLNQNVLKPKLEPSNLNILINIKPELKQEPNPMISFEFKCKFCNEKICELNTDHSFELDSEQSKNLPECIVKYAQSLNYNRILIIQDPKSKRNFEANSNVKEFSTCYKISFNSFFDDTTSFCWQFYECKSCFNIVALKLRFSLNTQCNFYLLFKDKLLLID